MESDHKIESVEHFDQPVEDALIVVCSPLKVFIEYSLRANGLKSQLLISQDSEPMQC